MPVKLAGKLVCPHCGGDLLEHIKSLWGRFRALHSHRKKTGFARASESEHLVASQRGGRNSWGNLSAEERADRIRKASEARWGKKDA